MGVVPSSRQDKITFYQNHLAPWADNAAAIGLTAQQVGDFATVVIAANSALMAAEAARQASKAATISYHEAVRVMHSDAGNGADLIRTIQNFALSTDDPNVYALAQIPEPQPAGETPPPGTPKELTVELLQNGALKLRWACDNPVGTQGTIYELKRQGPGQSSPEYIGSIGVREFLDETLASGDTPVQYEITALRSTKRGNPGVFTVKYGTGGAVFVSASSSSTSSTDTSVKLAA